MTKRFSSAPAGVLSTGRDVSSVLTYNDRGAIEGAVLIPASARRAPRRRRVVEQPAADLSAVELLEARILAAGRTLSAETLPPELRRLGRYRSAIARLQPGGSSPTRNTGADIDDLEAVLELLVGLDRADRLLVSYRMQGLGYRTIAKRHYPGRSHEFVRRCFRRILEALVHKTESKPNSAEKSR